VELLLREAECRRVVALARRPLPNVDPARLQCVVVDFEHLDRAADHFAVDAIICALGTTMRQAGSRERFRRVDFDYPLEAARVGRARGVAHYLLVSALGADSRSRVFYNRVKGELEEALASQGYPSLTIVRPSLLLGARREFRLGEAIAKRLAFRAPAGIRPVSARAVAAALVASAMNPAPGRTVLESAEIRSHYEG
jgi:uncharacterized protein YbjT (DUF2867 family)